MDPKPLLLALALAAFPAQSGAVLPQQLGNVDALTQFDGRIDGAAADALGGDVEGVGDVNGDGIEDVVAGVSDGDPMLVVFGTPGPFGVLAAPSLGARGFAINGADGADASGTPDMNGDGRAEIVVELPGDQAGVVFGRAGGAVNAAAPGGDGFLIGNTGNNTDVEGTGDVNGDGRGDLVIGNPGATFGGDANAGAAYVVFGKPTTNAVDATNLGSGGFTIGGDAASDFLGTSVGGGRDANGDGLADVLVSAQGRDANARNSSGSVYVIFGKPNANTVATGALGAQGFEVQGFATDDQLGRAVSMSGDMNGDGLAEVLVSSSFWENGNIGSAGAAWAVFGKANANAVDLLNLGGQGFRVQGNTANEEMGRSVAGGGDVNGDGAADMVVGALTADFNGRDGSGSGVVAFGKASGSTIDGNAIGGQGFRIDGGTAGDNLGRSTGVADVNGDGRADAMVGGIQADYAANNAGVVYVLYGFGTPGFTLSASSINGTVGTPVSVSASGIGRTGPATFSISPALPAGLSIDPASGAISGTPGGSQPATQHTVSMSDLAGTATQPLTVAVAARGAGTGAGAELRRSGRMKARRNRNGTITVESGFTAVCPAASSARCTGGGELRAKLGPRLTAPPRKADAAARKRRKRVRLTNQRLGGTSFTVGQGGTRKVSIKLSRKASKLFDRMRRMRMSATVKVRAGAGPESSSKRTATVKAPKKPRKKRSRRRG